MRDHLAERQNLGGAGRHRFDGGREGHAFSDFSGDFVGRRLVVEQGLLDGAPGACGELVKTGLVFFLDRRGVDADLIG